MIAELLSWEFAWPWMLLALPLPWLAARLLPPTRVGQGGALRTPFFGELETLAGAAARARKSHISPWMLMAWVLLCVAAARPQILGEAIKPPQAGRDLLLAVDLSGSMAAEDMRLGGRIVDRLTAVKAVLGDFLERRAGDRVGLLLFGERAYGVTPLTLDRNSVRQQLFDSVVGLAGQETAIGDAIALAVKRLSDPDEEVAEPGQRVLILLTDGVNTAGSINPLRATELAKSAGVRVHTIGFGGEGGDTFFGMRMPSRAQIDEATLRRVADTTGGRYFRARDTSELAGIYAELDRIEPTALPGETLQPRIERYVLPLSLAAVLALLLMLLPWLPGRRGVPA
ncbi:MAG: VWA domain-containing protein [Lysobacterales bacterium]